MNINKRQLKKWIAALDSGEYKLRNPNRFLPHLFDYVWPLDKKLLRYVNRDFSKKAGIPPFVLFSNDGFTFPEIATLLELVYIHKILD